MYLYGIYHWTGLFNSRQLLTLITYVKIISEVKLLIQAEHESEKAEAIAVYLSLVCDRCVDMNSRLSNWSSVGPQPKRSTAQHSLNLMWNYPENYIGGRFWDWCAESSAAYLEKLCTLFGVLPHSTNILGIGQPDSKPIQVEAASADNLIYIPDKSVNAVITDPPYYDSVRYAELSDFFYVWLRVNLLGLTA